jgi:fructokinase
VLSRPPLILAVGEILWDLLPIGKQLGGAPANFAFHAARLGADAKIISAVGDDDLGREILARLADLGLDTSSIAVDPKHPTGVVTVSLDHRGVPTYIIHENVAWDFIPTTHAAKHLAETADCVCFGTLAQRSPVSRDTIRDVLSHTRPECLRIFDVNLRQHYYDRDVIDYSLELTDVLKINDTELIEIARLYDLPITEGTPAFELQELFTHHDLDLIAVTRGDKGSVLYARDGTTHDHPGYAPARLADTVGAGDAFTAALAIGLLKSLPLDQINDHANRLASYVCSQPGATPRIPGDLLGLVARGAPRR